MPVGTGFRLSKVVVIESLEPHERKTGEEIAAFINASSGGTLSRLLADYSVCDNAPEFSRVIRALADDAQRTGSVPLVHVECHGGQHVGLEFRNGSVLSWQDLSALLLGLNVATRFNLVAVFSACYGAHFLSQVDSINPAPCYAMIAPTDSALDYELVSGFRTFYAALLSSNDAGVAVDTISRMSLKEGDWFSHLAEFWYERVTIGYIETHCTMSEMKQRALRMLHKLHSEGANTELGTLKKQLVQLNLQSLTGKFFDRYFITDLIPENSRRFSPVRIRVEQSLERLRKTGRYGV